MVVTTETCEASPKLPINDFRIVVVDIVATLGA